jgi:hypothetical protein
VGEVAGQQFVQQVNGPEDIMNDEPEDGMVVIPAYHQGIQAQQEIDDAGISSVHDKMVCA